MGNSSKAAAGAASALDMARRRGRKKKKGRPSLVDLKKRSPRLLQKQQQVEQQESVKRKRGRPTASDLLRRHSNSSSSAPGRMSTRRNPSRGDPSDDKEEEDEEEEEEYDDENNSRKEKKLRLVLDAAASNSPDRTEVGGANCGGKATDDGIAEKPEPGPTTSMPDKKVLIVILEKLEKKDTYGVFSEPVDPEELPDYHDIIEHPMDFGTIRGKLDKGEYANLEQFQSDIFLLCSNAMVYNASDTIYYRQARAIEELAKKDFANLRLPPDNREQEQKPPARRGRPPTKKPGRPPAADRGTPDPSPDVVPSSAGISAQVPNSRGPELPSKQPDKASIVDPPKNAFGLRVLENSWSNDYRLEKNDDFLGPGFSAGWSKWGKKLTEIDTSRRSTYVHPIPSDYMQDPPIFATFDSERKVLIPVGIHQPHAYSRSLARFAAKLSPAAWEIVAKRIEKVLPPGTKFGRSWVGESEEPQKTSS